MEILGFKCCGRSCPLIIKDHAICIIVLANAMIALGERLFCKSPIHAGLSYYNWSSSDLA
jgi:hypothetical protein